MGAQFERFLEKYISAWYIPEIKVVDIIEMIIISVLVYEIMVWIKNTKAWMLLKGMLVLCAFILVAAIFERIPFCSWRAMRSMCWRWRQLLSFSQSFEGHLKNSERKIFCLRLCLWIRRKSLSDLAQRLSMVLSEHALRWEKLRQER